MANGNRKSVESDNICTVSLCFCACFSVCPEAAAPSTKTTMSQHSTQYTSDNNENKLSAHTQPPSVEQKKKLREQAERISSSKYFMKCIWACNVGALTRLWGFLYSLCVVAVMRISGCCVYVHKIDIESIFLCLVRCSLSLSPLGMQ